MPGVLLFIILGTALTMSNALIGVKNLEQETEENTKEITESFIQNLENTSLENEISDKPESIEKTDDQMQN